jgi:hypothetical protein
MVVTAYSGAKARLVFALHMESSGAMIRASGIRHVHGGSLV